MYQGPATPDTRMKQTCDFINILLQTSYYSTTETLKSTACYYGRNKQLNLQTEIMHGMYRQPEEGMTKRWDRRDFHGTEKMNSDGGEKDYPSHIDLHKLSSLIKFYHTSSAM